MYLLDKKVREKEIHTEHDNEFSKNLNNFETNTKPIG